ncbi:AraC family transcriptional regulator [Streptomyces sp. VRA16 Mangrove soil]|uniref:helix-turn-helix domain-containing protein n=1 Tax=Streptomyces sp. VRA16 Mangrove soil TaxID=2817434 RepID=UPI001A9E4F29|nr:AraC family transcriptional regulator [Streptomyces sp. VRA16 Mangrove soil]MBO1337817.1 AraC family transcriptional regulator [Streptomyces sp. VRA16 Mangrove soil]
MDQDRDRDTRGIVDPAALLSRVRFRRHVPAPALRAHVESYWFIDWDLPAPYASHILAHPAVNLTFQWDEDEPHRNGPYGEFTGVWAPGLYTRKLTGRGRVCGVKFRPGAFRPFAPDVPVSAWTGRVLPYEEVFPATDPAAVLTPADDRGRAAALDAYLLPLAPAAPDPQADLACRVVARIQAERGVRRVADLAREEGLSVRSLQRLFAGYVGVSPKWCVLRYRIHEAVETAARRDDIDWAALAADLGYADQAHLVRDFTATLGVSPTAYPADG